MNLVDEHKSKFKKYRFKIFDQSNQDGSPLEDFFNLLKITKESLFLTIKMHVVDRFGGVLKGN
jgi:uncharacterized radical SAM superfamily protein